MTDLLFLGTGASIPSKTRALPAIAVRQSSDIVLFDCGEGVQRQFMISPMSFMKVSAIFITHLHGDHILGIPGLLQTMGMSGRKNELFIGGPKGIKRSVELLLAACHRSYTDHNPDATKDLEFPLNIMEMGQGSEVKFKGYSVSSFCTDHGVVSLGFKFTEDSHPGKFDRERAIRLGLVPGKDFSAIQSGETVKGVAPKEIIGPPRAGCTIVYSGDTVPCETLKRAAEGAEILIHESTYSGKDLKMARENKHSTAADAAELAKHADVKMLVLTHISNRYDDLSLIRDEASRIFKDTILAEDMLMLNITRKGIRSV